MHTATSRGKNDVPARPRLGDRQILKAFAERAPGGTGFAILAALLAHADEDYIAWPGYATIARIANVSTRTVERWIPKLEKSGFFRRKMVASGGRCDRTEYDMSGFVQQSLPFHADTPSASSSEVIPTQSRACTDKDSVTVSTQRRSKKPIKKTNMKPEGVAQRERRTSAASTRCPSDFRVGEDLKKWAAESFPRINLELETEAFRDHEFARARTDWSAAWRNWIRRASKFNSSYEDGAVRNSRSSDSYYDDIRRAADAYET